MKKLHYHLKNPGLREAVDLRKHSSDIAKATADYPMVKLEKVEKASYTISVNADDKKKNEVVRSLGHKIAQTDSLKKYVEHKGNKNVLFTEKRSVKEKAATSGDKIAVAAKTTEAAETADISQQQKPIDPTDRTSPHYDPFYDPSR